MADAPRMARRDASWFNHPDVYSPKVYHVIVSPPYVAACNPRILLVEFTEVSVDAALPGLRCQRRACRMRWEAAVSVPPSS